jgi:Cyclic nucleotide-binding domain/Major Facilitator Superfamily
VTAPLTAGRRTGRQRLRRVHEAATVTEGRLATVRAAFRQPDIRRIELGYGMSVMGELAGAVALVVYAFSAGGAALVAAYAASRALAGVVVALALAGVTGRLRGDRLLRWITGVRAVLLAAAAVMAALGDPAAAVIAAAAASSSLSGTYRPLQAAALPWLVRTPAELTASNAVTAVMENSAALIGPVLAGVLLAAATPAAAITLAAGSLGVATLLLVRLKLPDMPRAAGGAVHPVGDVTAGIAEFMRVAPPGGSAVLVFAQTLVRGALVVLIPVLAVHALALGESAVGWLNAGFGAGGLIGGVVAAAVVHVTRLGRGFIAGLLIWGLPLAVFALAPAAAIAYLALLIAGIGNAVEDTSSYTLVTRLAGPRAAGRVLSALEFIALAGLGTGSIIAPLLLRAFGVRGTFALLGGGLAGLALGHAARFMRLDRSMPAPGPQIGLLRNLAMFAPLPMAVTELLAAELQPRQFPAGAVVIREGEPGDRFYLIVEGSAAVSVRGTPRASLARGDCFGEIALLRDLARTATITAVQPLHTVALGRAEFLTAVTGNSSSRAAAETLVTRRLAAGS